MVPPYKSGLLEMGTLRDTFANNLKRARKARGLTQEGLAEAIGMTSTHVAYMENKRTWPSADTIAALALALGTSEESFFKPEGADQQPSPAQGEGAIFREILARLAALDEGHLEAVLSLLDGLSAPVTEPRVVRRRQKP